MANAHVDSRSSNSRTTSAIERRDAVTAAQVAAAPARDLDFAVVVGIADYRSLGTLKGAVSDAMAFRDWLCDPNGGGLAPAHVRLILSDREQGTPAQEEIDLELSSVLKAAAGRTRRLYFYFAGHGAMNPSRTGVDVALLLTRWSSTLARLALSSEHYMSALCAAGKFEELVIFLDCCRSVSVAVVGLQPLFVCCPDENPCHTRRFVAFACEARSPAFESQDAGRWRGLFTKCLLSILRQRWRTGIGADDLRRLLETEVARCARQYRVDQRAHVETSLLEHSRFGRPRPPSLPAAMRAVGKRWRASAEKLASTGRWPWLELRFVRRRGTVELLDHNLHLVAKHEAGAKPWRRRLPVGFYRIQGGGEESVVFEHDGWKASHDV